MTHSALLLICAAVASIGGAADGGDTATPVESAPYVVVLANDTVLATRTKPVSAFGCVRFIDAEGRARILSASEVDLAATRERNLEVERPADPGTLSILGPPAAADAGAVVTAAPLARTPRHDPPVQVYSATWCSSCRMLHQFLRVQQIEASVTEVDLLSLPSRSGRKSRCCASPGRCRTRPW